MKILSWNCRGIGRPRAIRDLKANIRNLNPDAIFLSITLVQNVNISAIINRLGFSSFGNHPPIGKWGGLLVLWRPGLDVEIVHISSNVIAMLVYSDPILPLGS